MRGLEQTIQLSMSDVRIYVKNMFTTECEIKPAVILTGGGRGGGGGRMLKPYAAAYMGTVLQLPYSQCMPKIQSKAQAKVLEGTEYDSLIV